MCLASHEVIHEYNSSQLMLDSDPQFYHVDTTPAAPPLPQNFDADDMPLHQYHTFSALRRVSKLLAMEAASCSYHSKGGSSSRRTRLAESSVL